jgi:hypothetical protein
MEKESDEIENGRTITKESQPSEVIARSYQ